MPVPGQALSVHYNNVPFTIDLDSGATVGFIRQDIAQQLDLNIKENGQYARLADKKTQMKSLGEVDILVTESTTQDAILRLRALVVKELHVMVVKHFILTMELLMIFP